MRILLLSILFSNSIYAGSCSLGDNTTQCDTVGTGLFAVQLFAYFGIKDIVAANAMFEDLDPNQMDYSKFQDRDFISIQYAFDSASRQDYLERLQIMYDSQVRTTSELDAELDQLEQRMKDIGYREPQIDQLEAEFDETLYRKRIAETLAATYKEKIEKAQVEADFYTRMRFNEPLLSFHTRSAKEAILFVELHSKQARFVRVQRLSADRFAQVSQRIRQARASAAGLAVASLFTVEELTSQILANYIDQMAQAEDAIEFQEYLE